MADSDQPDSDLSLSNQGEINHLSDRKLKLLGRYFDGECSVFQYWLARRLLSKSVEARNYVRNLKAVEGLVQEVTQARCESYSEVDLWGRISARIEAEERAEVFLGGHNQRRRSRLNVMREWLREFQAGLTWAAGGAALASVCAFALVRSGLINSSTAGSVQVAAEGGDVLMSNIISPVSLSSRANEAMSFERRAEIAGTDFDPLVNGHDRSPGSGSHRFNSINAFEIDWVRSEGRLHMLQDPNERTAIIWVKPKQQKSNELALVSNKSASHKSLRRSARSNLPIAIPAAGR